MSEPLVAHPGSAAETPPRARGTASEDVLRRGQARLYPNYRPASVVFDRGRGCELWDLEGRRYLDFFAGIAVSTLGHGHPRLVAAISDQAARLVHVSNYFVSEPSVRLAEALCERSGFDRVLFANSGTEAIEALLKLCRRHHFARGQRDRYRVIAFENSFHGRTLGALTATGQSKYREGFGPLTGVTHVPYGDLDAVRGVLADDVAGILVEPIQGEGGVVPAPPGFLKGLRTLADAHGCLLLGDEVQTGIGRTGHFLGFDGFGVRPDAVAVAKGLGAGFPIGAVLCTEALAEALPPGSHGSTFAGSPLASRVALTVLEVLKEDGLQQRARERGEQLSASLLGLARRHPRVVAGERGMGLLRAVLLHAPADPARLRGDLMTRGLLVAPAGGRTLRLCPPLVVTEQQVEEAVACLDEAVRALD